jgi:TolB protein
MNTDGSHPTLLLQDSFNDHSAVWSHDGKQIAFTSDRTGAWEIYKMKADTTGVVQLTHSAPGFGLPVWSPDDSRILFGQAAGDSEDIYVMQADGSDLRRLTRGAAN